MRIVSLTAMIVRVALKRPIKHASHERSGSDNVFVRCELADGTVGYGEGVPRSYVTGETADGAIVMFEGTKLTPTLGGELTDWPSVWDACSQISPRRWGDDPRGCGGNALRCAIELSVLDAYGQVFGEPIWKGILHAPVPTGLTERRDAVRYSTTITAETRWGEVKSAMKMRAYGFHQCKIKVGLAGNEEVARLKRLRRILGRAIDLRLDANEAWSYETAARVLLDLQSSSVGISCIEQPLPHGQWDALARLRREGSIPVMLDESLTGPVDAEQAIESQACDLFNLRLSKCGGMLACLQLAARARQQGIGYQLGCHPGETGVLSAAGRHWACSVAGIRYLEGSYDRHLLRQNVITTEITFGYGGLAPRLDRPGLGVKVDESRLASLVRTQKTQDLN